MRFRLNYFYIFLGFFFFSVISPTFTFNANAQESVKINLKKELKQGNFLVGLKQYLGGEYDKFSVDKFITFSTDNNFITLLSHNGVKHKSKNINILWKNVPLETPYSIERLVLGPFASYESAKKQANILKEQGHEALIAFPKNWEVWIPFQPRLLNKGNYKLFKKTYKSQIIPILSNEYSQQKLQGPIYISSNEQIYINGVSFGKEFYLAKDSYGSWTLIQKINFDDYLQGVLPYEIGSNSPLEALKAQAVIARTWALYNSERFNIDNYHLCISSQCQVYKPPKVEYKNVKRAIQDTSNLIITFRNKPINSFYHATNGGISASASESWSIEDYPYFNSIIDAKDNVKESIKLPIKNNYELNKFLDFGNDKFYGNYHSLFRWKRKISNSKILDNLRKNKLIDSKENIFDLNISERGKSGRVTELEIKTNNLKKPIFLVKDDIRRILSFLPSNLFTINKLNDNFWLFRGGGFGHGVGLSQSGAIEMAKLGFTYEQILNHYYQKTKIKKIEILSQ